MSHTQATTVHTPHADQLIVQKFGGTSLKSAERIAHSARHTIHAIEQLKQKVVVVVSAMAGETNRLVQLVNQCAYDSDHTQEALHANANTDVVISAGEQISCGLFALALQKQGIAAQALTAWQIGLESTGAFGHACILSIKRSPYIMQLLSKGITPVIAGFQGVFSRGEQHHGGDTCLCNESVGNIKMLCGLPSIMHPTTLGRGGGDTSAVAIAALIGAHRCDIYTDVQGVFGCDPRVVPQAKSIERISYSDMLALSQYGAKVVHPHAVEWAKKHNVVVCVRSSFDEPYHDRSTYVTHEDDAFLVCLQKSTPHERVSEGDNGMPHKEARGQEDEADPPKNRLSYELKPKNLLSGKKKYAIGIASSSHIMAVSWPMFVSKKDLTGPNLCDDDQNNIHTQGLWPYIATYLKGPRADAAHQVIDDGESLMPWLCRSYAYDVGYPDIPPATPCYTFFGPLERRQAILQHTRQWLSIKESRMFDAGSETFTALPLQHIQEDVWGMITVVGREDEGILGCLGRIACISLAQHNIVLQEWFFHERTLHIILPRQEIHRALPILHEAYGL